MRSIVLLIDGTGVSAGSFRGTFSNVFCVGQALDKRSLNQDLVLLYFPGPASRKGLGRISHAVNGSEMNEMLLEVYVALCLNIKDRFKDKVYIFGYSRGAAVAKALVSFVADVGLLPASKLDLLESAYYKYAFNNLTEGLYVRNEAYPINVEFVGLFDPVPGPITSMIKLKIDEHLSRNVLNAIELFAIDEKRAFYAPRIWRSKHADPFAENIAMPLDNLGDDRLQQIWLPGGHGDVGDGEGRKAISLISLLTMLERLHSRTAILLDKEYIKKIYDQVQGREVELESRAGVLNSKRRPLRQPNADLHKVYDEIVDQRIVCNGKIYYYSRFANDAAFRRYSYDLTALIDE